MAWGGGANSYAGALVRPLCLQFYGFIADEWNAMQGGKPSYCRNLFRNRFNIYYHLIIIIAVLQLSFYFVNYYSHSYDFSDFWQGWWVKNNHDDDGDLLGINLINKYRT